VRLSIVTTTYQSSSTISQFIQRIVNAAQKITLEYELIIVDDGSTDDSVAKVEEALSKSRSIKLIKLSRNFGHHQAILSGLQNAVGEVIFLIDSDLEEAPELLGVFWNEFQASNSDVIFGVEKTSSKNWHTRIISKLFWRLFNRYTRIQIPEGICTVRLMNRNYVQALLSHKEVNIFLAGLWEITGFKQSPLIIEKLYKGSTTYGYKKKLDLALTAIVSFSGRPLRIIALFGLALVLSAFSILILLIMRYFLVGESIQGWLSLVGLIVMFGGIQVISIGIVAIYVATILEEVKSRPRVIISSISLGKK
jgi:putative glycosyltransferase